MYSGNTSPFGNVHDESTRIALLTEFKQKVIARLITEAAMYMTGESKQADYLVAELFGSAIRVVLEVE